jgi:YHS domain-containing protein
MRFIIFALLVYLLYRLIRGIFLAAPKQQGRREPASGPAIVDEMVIDPVCRVYIPRREALTARVEGETVYFCSRECMNKYLQDKPENS